ncbi:PEGA domain-containing protein, partial [Candidatus Sumerlaeota bacterium]|nr:PEGA domain-containing protein [Candidatus Sumerlaeota bacterium]
MKLDTFTPRCLTMGAAVAIQMHAGRQLKGGATMCPKILKSVSLLLIFVCGLELSGCSFFVPSRQTLTVSSDPPGADVTINGENAGATPVSYKVRRNADASIMVRKKGYETATRTTSTQISAWGILDIIGG